MTIIPTRDEMEKAWNDYSEQSNKLALMKVETPRPSIEEIDLQRMRVDAALDKYVSISESFHCALN